MNKQETIPDIIAEMKREASQMFPAMPIAVLRLATRLEAAHRRGLLTKTRKNVNSGAASDTAGNSAKLREVVERIVKSLSGKMAEVPAAMTSHEVAILKQCRAALAAPARNCDVGTAEEQAERYVRYCDKFTLGGMHCETCPCCGKIQFGKCEFAWAQMPYEEQEGGSK